MKKKKTKSGSQRTGGAVRMVELGYSAIQIWLTADEKATIKAAADKDQRPVTKFVTIAALKAAEQFLEQGDLP